MGLADGLVEGHRRPALTYPAFGRSGALVLAGRYMEVRQLRDIIDVPEIIQRVLRKVGNEMPLPPPSWSFDKHGIRLFDQTISAKPMVGPRSQKR